MPTLRLAPFLLVACLRSAAWSAALCVQNGNSEMYKSDQPALDCRLPESLKFHAKPSGQSGSANGLSGETAGRSGPAPTIGTQASWALRAEDGSVYAALKRWSVSAGWQISWEIPVDFPIEIEDVSGGSYEFAVRRVLTAFRVSDYPPHPCFHENRVVRVVRRIQGNDDECR